MTEQEIKEAGQALALIEQFSAVMFEREPDTMHVLDVECHSGDPENVVSDLWCADYTTPSTADDEDGETDEVAVLRQFVFAETPLKAVSQLIREICYQKGWAQRAA